MRSTTCASLSTDTIFISTDARTGRPRDDELSNGRHHLPARRREARVEVVDGVRGCGWEERDGRGPGCTRVLRAGPENVAVRSEIGAEARAPQHEPHSGAVCSHLREFIGVEGAAVVRRGERADRPRSGPARPAIGKSGRKECPCRSRSFRRRLRWSAKPWRRACRPERARKGVPTNRCFGRASGGGERVRSWIRWWWRACTLVDSLVHRSANGIEAARRIAKSELDLR
jgi:hypothetical protein